MLEVLDQPMPVRSSKGVLEFHALGPAPVEPLADFGSVL